jgi:hypothetical protein
MARRATQRGARHVGQVGSGERRRIEPELAPWVRSCCCQTLLLTQRTASASTSNRDMMRPWARTRPTPQRWTAVCLPRHPSPRQRHRAASLVDAPGSASSLARALRLAESEQRRGEFLIPTLRKFQHRLRRRTIERRVSAVRQPRRAPSSSNSPSEGGLALAANSRPPFVVPVTFPPT